MLRTTYCDTAGGGSDGGEAVTGTGSHTLSVAGTGAYRVWASWSAPVMPPSPSAEQTAAMADAIVTEAEYRAGFDRYAQCMTDAGYPVDVIDATAPIIRYVNSGAAVHSGVEGHCYALELALLDATWQAANQRTARPQPVDRRAAHGEATLRSTETASAWRFPCARERSSIGSRSRQVSGTEDGLGQRPTRLSEPSRVPEVVRCVPRQGL